MKPGLTNPKSVLATTAVVLLALSFLPARFSRLSAMPHNLVTALCTPASDGVKRISDMLGRPRDDPQHEEFEKVREDRDRLLSYSRQLEQELDKANLTIQQFTRVGQQAQLKGTQFILAEVTAFGDAGRNPVLTINRGLRDGIQKGWIVTSGANLVGWIATTPGQVTSTVRLITAPNTVLIVEVLPQVAGPAPKRGLVPIEAEPNGRFFSLNLNQPEQYHINDVAYLRDESFPREAAGRVIGRVSSIEKDPADPTLRRRLVIVPEVSLRYLSQVIIIAPPGVTQQPQ